MGRKKLQPEVRDRTKLIIKGKPNKYHKADVKVDFKVTKKHVLFPRVKDRPVLPVFNTDRKYYTPAFTLKDAGEINDDTFIKLHQKKVNQSLNQEEREIMMPCPRMKTKFCGVCRDHFQDYKDHLEQQKHLQAIGKSVCQKMIVAFCNEFRKRFGVQDQFGFQKSISVETKLSEEENSTETLAIHEKADDKQVQVLVFNQ